MALTAISTADVTKYVSDGDPCKRREPLAEPRIEDGVEIFDEEVIDPGATVFLLGGLDVFLMAQIYDQASSLTRGAGSDVGIHTRLNQTNLDAVRHGLKGWQNFKDADGNDVPFETAKVFVQGRKYRGVTDDGLNRLGIRLIGELARVIKDLSEVAAGEEKNSVTAS